MKKTISSSDPLYPGWVCKECGRKAAEKAGTTPLLFSTFHNGTCGVCGENTSVTELRDFGSPPVEIDIDKMKARDEAEDKVSPVASVNNLFISEDVKSDLWGHLIINHKAMVFCDIDGLFADCSHRLPYLENKEYDKFYGANMAEDSAAGMASAATIAFLSGLTTIYKTVRFRFLTGRPRRTRALTAMWLRQYYPALFEESMPFDDDAILCRGDDDFRAAPYVKMDAVVDYFKANTLSPLTGDVSDYDFVRGNFDTYVLDDDPNVIMHFNKKFNDIMATNFGCDHMYCHGILVTPDRLGKTPSSSAPNKSLEE